jgi:hypothetical protein
VAKNPESLTRTHSLSPARRVYSTLSRILKFNGEYENDVKKSTDKSRIIINELGLFINKIIEIVSPEK